MSVLSVLGLGALALLGNGCARFQAKPANKFVYVTAKQAFLRDRVAAVSNRTGSVSNGEKLVVLDRARRFVKVRTPQGEVGWIEENKTAGQEIADEFDVLKQAHARDSVVATATTRDEVVLHLAPGRETEHFYRLAEGDTLSLLGRATVAKQAAPGAAAPIKPKSPDAVKPKAADAKPVPAKPETKPAPTAEGDKDEAAVNQSPPIPYEDWWLVRDAKGEVGWIYSRMIDVSAPDTLSRYAEGQRIVGAYILTHVDDPDSGMVDNGNPVTSIPVYVTVLSPYKAGLPYDFDQVRIFTWNVKKHRYETAMRERNIEGYLPVQIADKADPYGHAANSAIPLPTFMYRVLSADAPTPTPDATTGTLTPGKTIAKTYRLEGNICRRILPPGTPPPAEAHPAVEEKKDKSKKKKK